MVCIQFRMSRASLKFIVGGETGRVAVLALLLWTLLLSGSLLVGLRQQKQYIFKQAESEARAIVGMDISFRNWVVSQGSVYVSVKDTVPPDYEFKVPDKYIKTPSGRKLMRVSHAYAMRQLSAERRGLGQPYTHLFSLNPKNPAEAADALEQAAIAGFMRDGNETLVRNNGERVRFIRAFRIEAACISCHTFNDSPGGLRGAISADVPVEAFARIGAHLRLHWIAWHLLAWLFGIIGILLSYKYIKQAQLSLSASEYRYRNLFETSRDALMTLAPPDWAFNSGNYAALAMFKAGSEAEFSAYSPQSLSPERQPDGRLSAEKAKELLEAAMKSGTQFFEWTHRRMNGEDFPADVLLTRMEAEGEFFLQATVRDITGRKREQARREALLAELRESLAQVKYLSGLIPICSSCKKIRNNKGVWESVEHYVAEHSDAKFSHGICPDCGSRLYGELYDGPPPRDK